MTRTCYTINSITCYTINSIIFKILLIWAQYDKNLTSLYYSGITTHYVNLLLTSRSDDELHRYSTFVVDDTDVLTDEGGQVYVELDRFIGRGSTEETVEDGIDGSDRDRVRGLWAGWPEIRTSDIGATTDGKGATLSQLLMLSIEPSVEDRR